MSEFESTARTREPRCCPNDGSRLVEVERSEIFIDACPECRDVWLDRGEPDKILVRERQLASRDPTRTSSAGRRPPQPRPRDEDYEDDPRRRGRRRGPERRGCA